MTTNAHTFSLHVGCPAMKCIFCRLVLLLYSCVLWFLVTFIRYVVGAGMEVGRQLSMQVSSEICRLATDTQQSSAGPLSCLSMVVRIIWVLHWAWWPSRSTRCSALLTTRARQSLDSLPRNYIWARSSSSCSKRVSHWLRTFLSSERSWLLTQSMSELLSDHVHTSFLLMKHGINPSCHSVSLEKRNELCVAVYKNKGVAWIGTNDNLLRGS